MNDEKSGLGMSEYGLDNTPVNEDSITANEQPAVKLLTSEEYVSGLTAIRNERKKLDDRKKELVAEWRDLESGLLALLDSQGAKSVGTGTGTATITENILPTIKDWDVLTAYIIQNDATHLLQRRVSSAAFRELQLAGVDIPGVEPYTQRQISLRRRTT